MTKKNDIIEVKINSLDFPNKGKGEFEDYKVIVKDTLPGQTVLAKIAKKKNGVIHTNRKEAGNFRPLFLRLTTQINKKSWRVWG